VRLRTDCERAIGMSPFSDVPHLAPDPDGRTLRAICAISNSIVHADTVRTQKLSVKNLAPVIARPPRILFTICDLDLGRLVLGLFGGVLSWSGSLMLQQCCPWSGSLMLQQRRLCSTILCPVVGSPVSNVTPCVIASHDRGRLYGLTV